MKRSEIRDRGGAATHPRHPRPQVWLPRFNAVQTLASGFRAASGLRQAIPSFLDAGCNAVILRPDAAGSST